MDSLNPQNITVQGSQLLLYGVGGFIASLIGLPLLRKLFPNIGTSADPHKKHKWSSNSPPTVGGIMLLPLVITGILLNGSSAGMIKTLSLIAGIFCAFLLGLYDDAMGTNPFVKLLGQFICANLLVGGDWQGHFSGYLPLDYTLSVLSIIFIMNAYNLIDNMDGISGSIALIWTLAFLVYLTPSEPLLGRGLWATVGGGLLGFLFFNFPPARVFLGDVGTQMLGALFAVCMLSVFAQHPPETLTLEGLLISIVPMGYFAGMPVVDTLTVLIQRPLRGIFPFYGGRDHITHFIAHMAGERSALIIVCLLQVILSGAGVYLFLQKDVSPVFAGFGILAGVFVIFQAVYYYTYGRHLSSLNS